jgi:hypothetical protein
MWGGSMDDFSRDYATHMDRAPTEALVDLLREHHPELETMQGWQPPRDWLRLLMPPPEPKPIPIVAIAKPKRLFAAPTTAQAVVNDVAIEHGLSVDDIIGRDRSIHVARARHVAMFKLRQIGLSTPVIGKMLGGRDHTTVLHGIRRVRAEAVSA